MELFSPVQPNSSSPGLRGEPFSAGGTKSREGFSLSEQKGSNGLPSQVSPEGQSTFEKSELPGESSPHRVTGQERAAVQKFARQVKENLGIEAEQLMMAFSQVSALGHQSPPTHQIDHLIESLSLDVENKAQAEQMFSELFEATPGRSLKDYATVGAGGMGLVSMLGEGRAQNQLHQSLEDLTQKFFIEQKIKSGKESNNQESSEVSQRGAFRSSPIDPAQLAESGKFPSAQLALGLAEQQKRAPALQGDQSLSGEESAPLGMDKEAQGPLKALANPPLESTLNQDLEGSESGQHTSDSSNGLISLEGLEADNSTASLNGIEEQAEPLPPTSSAADRGTLAKGADLLGPEAGPKDSRGEFISPVGTATAPSSGSSELSSSSSAPLVSRVNSTDAEANINEILNQAQFVAKRGGGEVKVILYPEGLGEVSLKVNVKDGQINVQMLTQSVEAKNLLETQLGDLRSQLMAQKINVDQIKVETSEFARDFNQQQDQQQRQAAQNFMEQFRQENQAFRRGFLDMPGIRAYKSQIHDPAENEEMVAAAQSARREAMARRLDLVA